MNKFNKAKTIGLISASLAGVSLMGVGFAAWVVNGTTPATTTDISVAIADVEDKRIIIEKPIVNGTLNFDADSADKDGNIQASANNLTPSLSFSISYTVKLGKQLSDFNINAKCTFASDDASTALKDAIETKKYLSSPLSSTGDTLISTKDGHGNSYSAPTDYTTTTNIHSVSTEGADSNEMSTYNITTTFHFAWGSVTGTKNPSRYDDTDEHTTTALTALNALKAANGGKFTITLTPSVVA